MITGWILGDANLVAKLNYMPGGMQTALRKTVQRLALQLLSVTKKKLSDDVLHVRTGRLRRSINQRVEEEGHSVTGVVGSNVVYAKRQEYGFTGNESVKAHLRNITKVFGKSVTPHQISVKSFSRKVNYPAHSFLRTALEEMRPQIEAEMSKAMGEAMK